MGKQRVKACEGKIFWADFSLLFLVSPCPFGKYTVALWGRRNGNGRGKSRDPRGRPSVQRAKETERKGRKCKLEYEKGKKKGPKGRESGKPRSAWLKGNEGTRAYLRHRFRAKIAPSESEIKMCFPPLFPGAPSTPFRSGSASAPRRSTTEKRRRRSWTR